MGERSLEEKLSELIKVELTEPKNFVKVKDLLKRVGINPRGTKNLFQTCHIYCHGSDYYICHFKELFWLDGRVNGMDHIDEERRNRIVALLMERNLIKPVRRLLPFGPKAAISVRIAPYAEIQSWKLFPKYRFKIVRNHDPETIK
jgi:hypothetical protein